MNRRPWDQSKSTVDLSPLRSKIELNVWLMCVQKIPVTPLYAHRDGFSLPLCRQFTCMKFSPLRKVAICILIKPSARLYYQYYILQYSLLLSRNAFWRILLWVNRSGLQKYRGLLATEIRYCLLPSSSYSSTLHRADFEQKLQLAHNVAYAMISAARFTYVTILLSKLHLLPLSFQCNSKCWLLSLTRPDYVLSSTCLTRSDKAWHAPRPSPFR